MIATTNQLCHNFVQATNTMNILRSGPIVVVAVMQSDFINISVASCVGHLCCLENWDTGLYVVTLDSGMHVKTERADVGGVSNSPSLFSLYQISDIKASVPIKLQAVYKICFKKFVYIVYIL